MKNYFTNSELADIFEQALTEGQILAINEPTPEEYIEIKKDEDGHEYKSVKAFYVKKRLNMIFGFNYDFKILKTEYYAQFGEAIVHGKLVVKTKFGKISREQIGKAPVEYKTSTKSKNNSPSNLGNAMKAAASDALKKCASEFGICWDVYGQERPEKESKTDKLRSKVKKNNIQNLTGEMP